MKAIYTPNLHCDMCYDTSELFGGITAEGCKHCQEINKQEVEVLDIGIFYSTVFDKDGKIKKVKTSRLRMMTGAK